MKVSELKEVQELLNTSYLMAVQNGESVKFSAQLLQMAANAIDNAAHLNGYSDTDFAKLNANGQNNADLLEGYEASHFATKDDLNAIATNTDDPTWCTPKLWFNAAQLPDGNNEYYWRWCDGQWLDKTEFSDLFAVIGYQFTRDQDSGKVYTADELATLGHTNDFRIPDLQGRFILGAYIGTPKQTSNLRALPNKYNVKDFTSDGQYVFPGECGYMSGDPTTTMDSTQQMPVHTHEITSNALKKTEYSKTGGAGSSLYAAATWESASITAGYEGVNGIGCAVYPYNEKIGGNFNYGMLSMPPYTSFSWCMRVRKAKING